MATVVVSPFDVANFPGGGGHFWVYMQYAQGLRRLGCEVYWLEQFRPGKDPDQDTRAIVTFFERMDRFGLKGRVLLYRLDDGAGGPIHWIGVEPRVAEAVLPTRFGEFRMIAYASDVDHDQHVALVRGELEGTEPALVRVHSHCLTGDVFGSTACDCSELVSRSLAAIAKEDRGVFLYLHHTGRGFSVDSPEEPGVLPQIHFHKRGQLDREPARQRMVQHESGIGAQILIDLGLKDIRVLTNHPKKVVALEGYGIRIADQVPLRIDQPKPTHQTL